MGLEASVENAFVCELDRIQLSYLSRAIRTKNLANRRNTHEPAGDAVNGDAVNLRSSSHLAMRSPKGWLAAVTAKRYC
jgi:hypothetical protein